MCHDVAQHTDTRVLVYLYTIYFYTLDDRTDSNGNSADINSADYEGTRDPIGLSFRSESSSTVSRFDELTDRPKDLLANVGSAYCSGRSWTDATPSSESEQGEIGPPEDPTVKAANVVCHMLVLNAWRRRRAEIAQREQQVEHLHLQIEFLRRLLLAENDRVSRLNSELHREKSQLDETTNERDTAKSVRPIVHVHTSVEFWVWV